MWKQAAPVRQPAFQSALPVRGAIRRDDHELVRAAVSIRAPCEGSDLIVERAGHADEVSIRAPCEGSDAHRFRRRQAHQGFNPRSL